MRLRNLISAVVVLALMVAVAACGEGSSDKKAHEAVPTYYSKYYPERHIYNERIRMADDPSTVQFCTVYPFDAPPHVVVIAAKLVSSGKRPDKPYYLDDKGEEENPDPQGMYGKSAEYRYGFEPSHVYHDFTDLGMECSTSAQAYEQTNIGLVSVVDPALTKAGERAHAALKAGIILQQGKDGKEFGGFTPEAQQQAGEIIHSAIMSESKGTTGVSGK